MRSPQICNAYHCHLLRFSGFLLHSVVILAFTSENSTTNIFTANRKPFRYLYHISGKYLLQQEACGGLFALYIDQTVRPLHYFLYFFIPLCLVFAEIKCAIDVGCSSQRTHKLFSTSLEKQALKSYCLNVYTVAVRVKRAISWQQPSIMSLSTMAISVVYIVMFTSVKALDTQ